MRHPWLEIPITDYEAHMALPSVGQAQLLGTALQRTITQFQPCSLAVLGVAGGNDLKFAQRAGVRRLVALDFNPDYLALCSRRYATDGSPSPYADGAASTRTARTVSCNPSRHRFTSRSPQDGGPPSGERWTPRLRRWH